jgi:hypothetical protein
MKQIKTEIEDSYGTNPCNEIISLESVECLFNSQIICADCKKCYNGCKNNFPEEYITGGADKCKDFEIENDTQVIKDNLIKKEKEIVNKYAERGFVV